MSDESDARNPETRLTEAGRRSEWTGIPGQPGGVVNPPVWRASTILYEDTAHLKSGAAGKDNHWYYGRRGTPTQWALADALTEMEPGAAGTALFPSGVAAISTTLMAVLQPGDQLLMVDSVYEPTRTFCEQMLRPLGIDTLYYDPMTGAGIEALISPNTRAIFLESPGSLTMEVQDIPAIAEIARSRGVVTILDNTWATPLFFPALSHGVDISILACTKYIVGHSDVMLGSVTANAALWPRLQQTARMFGQICGPDDAWLAMRGLRTLAVRLAQHQRSALEIAQWLDERPEVGRVFHPALSESPGHQYWKRDFSGSSGLFSFTLRGADTATRAQFIDSLTHFGIGYSWGGYESLAIPADPQRCRTAKEWTEQDPVIRLHIGLEHPSDLMADLDRAFKNCVNRG